MKEMQRHLRLTVGTPQFPVVLIPGPTSSPPLFEIFLSTRQSRLGGAAR
jgi:hypothetical protein